MNIYVKLIIYSCVFCALLFVLRRYSNEIFMTLSSPPDRKESISKDDIDRVMKISEAIIPRMLNDLGIDLHGNGVEFEKRAVLIGDISYPLLLLRLTLPAGLSVETLKVELEKYMRWFPEEVNGYITLSDPVTLSMRLWFKNLLLYKITFEEDLDFTKTGNAPSLSLLFGVNSCSDYERFIPFIESKTPASYEISLECDFGMKYSGMVMEGGGEIIMDGSMEVDGDGNLVIPSDIRNRLLSYPAVKGISIPRYRNLKGLIRSIDILKEFRLFLFLKAVSPDHEESNISNGRGGNIFSKKGISKIEIPPDIPHIKANLSVSSVAPDLGDLFLKFKKIGMKKNWATAYILLEGNEEKVMEEMERAKEEGFIFVLPSKMVSNRKKD